jgi:hypothetical protein
MEIWIEVSKELRYPGDPSIIDIALLAAWRSVASFV